MKSVYQEHPVLIQEGLRFVTKILGLEYVLTTIATGIAMKDPPPMLHATQWDILPAVKVKEYSASYSMKNIINHKSQHFVRNFENL